MTLSDVQDPSSDAEREATETAAGDLQMDLVKLGGEPDATGLAKSKTPAKAKSGLTLSEKNRWITSLSEAWCSSSLQVAGHQSCSTTTLQYLCSAG